MSLLVNPLAIKSIVLSPAIPTVPWDEFSCGTKSPLSFQPTETFKLTFRIFLGCHNPSTELVLCIERIINFFFLQGRYHLQRCYDAEKQCDSLLLRKKKLHRLFLGAVLGLQKNSTESTEIPLPPSHCFLPQFPTLLTSWPYWGVLVVIDEPIVIHCY